MLLLDPSNQGLGVHFCVPDVHNINDVLILVISIDDLKTSIHNMAPSEKSFLSE